MIPDRSWGCDICRGEIRAVTFERVKTLGEATTTYLKILQCQECRQWFEWQLNGRIYDINPGRGREWLLKIAEGL